MRGCGRIVVQVPLGQPDAPDVHRPRRMHVFGVAQDQLRRATTDVGHQERLGIPTQLPSGTGVGQRGLLLAGDHLRVDAENRTHAGHQHILVAGVPGRAGGHHPDLDSAQSVDLLGIVT